MTFTEVRFGFGSSVKVQILALFRYLLNNGIDNLWYQCGNIDDFVIADFPISSDQHESIDPTLASPTIILQPHQDTMGIFDSNIATIQVRFEWGILEIKQDSPTSTILTHYGMAGWKVAFENS